MLANNGMVFRIPFFLNKKKRIIDDINRYRALQGEKKKVLFCQFSACLSVYSFLDHCWTMLWVDVSHYMVHSTKQKAVEKKESVLMVHDIYIISLSLSTPFLARSSLCCLLGCESLTLIIIFLCHYISFDWVLMCMSRKSW